MCNLVTTFSPAPSPLSKWRNGIGDEVDSASRKINVKHIVDNFSCIVAFSLCLFQHSNHLAIDSSHVKTKKLFIIYKSGNST